jgi:hypothetical protein
MKQPRGCMRDRHAHLSRRRNRTNPCGGIPPLPLLDDDRRDHHGRHDDGGFCRSLAEHRLSRRGSTILFVGLMAALGFWRRSEGSISVNTVATPKVEGFYWATIRACAAPIFHPARTLELNAVELGDSSPTSLKRSYPGIRQWAANVGDIVFSYCLSIFPRQARVLRQA